MLRAVAECSKEPSPYHNLDATATKAIVGVVDRKPPTLVSATSSSNGHRWVAGDSVDVTYSEDIVCDGVVMDESKVMPQVRLTVGSSEYLSGASGVLQHSCHGPTIKIALPGGVTASLQGKTVAVEVTKRDSGVASKVHTTPGACKGVGGHL